MTAPRIGAYGPAFLRLIVDNFPQGFLSTCITLDSFSGQRCSASAMPLSVRCEGCLADGFPSDMAVGYGEIDHYLDDSIRYSAGRD